MSPSGATTAQPARERRRLLRGPDLSVRAQERTHAFLFLLPTLLVLALFVGFPLVYSVILTFTGAPPAPGQFGKWVGIDNWRQVFGDSVFGQSFRQTLMYLGPSIVLAPLFGLFVAIVLNHEFPGRKLVRASLLLPWAIPPVVVAAMFEWFLDPNRGLLGYWLTKIGVVKSSPLFFSGVPQTLFVLVGIHIWKTFPLLAIMFLVALQYLPDEQLHAARIDGAGFWHRLRYIILPHLRPTIVAALVVQFLITITLFDIIFALTGGGPGQYSTYNLYFYAFKQSFEYNNFNLGSVIAYVVSGLVMGFALILTRGRSRMSLT